MGDEILPLKTSSHYVDGITQKFNVAHAKVEKVVKAKKGTKITASNSMDYTYHLPHYQSF